MKALTVLGMDFGASNARCIAGNFNGDTVVLNEIHRFPNNPVMLNNSIYWDIMYLYREMEISIAKAIMSLAVSSIGIDTWAQDFGILDYQGNLIGNPHCYRDTRTDGLVEKVSDILPAIRIYRETGMAPSHICSLFQLLSMKDREKVLLDMGSKLLFIPGLFSYFLSGEMCCDSTMASMSLLYSPFKKDWISEYLKLLDLPEILPSIVEPGKITGKLTKTVGDRTGAGRIPLITIAGHDTASAVLAVPSANMETAVYISCGTWSIVGKSVRNPIINDCAYEKGFANEIGYDNEVMFVKNVTGLWILQECIKEWKQEGFEICFDNLVNWGLNNNFESFIDVEDQQFTQPGQMNRKIIEFCKKTGQVIPKSKEEIYSCIMRSLALKYSEVINDIRSLTSEKVDKIHVIGGGARDRLLCTMISMETGLEVIAGPYEASAFGNIIAQLIALGEVKDVKEAKDLIVKSFQTPIY